MLHMFTILATLHIAFLVSLVVWRFHRPSSLPPGPRGWPIIGNALQIPGTHQHVKFAEWARQWGDVMSVSLFGRPMIILNSATHAMEVLEKRSAISCSRYCTPVAGDMIGWSTGMIFAPYGPRLREMRKLLAHVLATRQSVSRFHPLVEKETRRFVQQLQGRSDSLVQDLRRLAGSIIIMMTYGYEVEGDDDPLIKTVDQVLEEYAQSVAPGAFLADTFPFLRYVPSWFPGAQWKRKVAEQRKHLAHMNDIPFEWAKKRISAGTALPSFTSMQLEDNPSAEKEELIKWTAASLYGGMWLLRSSLTRTEAWPTGGADTTVSAITSFFLAMICFPEVQRKAQAEIDAVVGDDRLPTIQHRDQMPYMNALVLEVLRWLPVGPIGFAHQLVEDDIYEGYLLPKGALVVANVWEILHDPQTYSEPMVFNPDRFISTQERVAERDPRDLCFGFGRRKCPGNVFAEVSIFAACSMVLAVYSLSKFTKDGKTVEPLIEGTGALISHPLPFKMSVAVRSKKALALLHSMAMADGLKV
ncbi:cytochrome P450 [Trametes sanguinea]|nr:cytochrome P450 [Trametes sanguinea]